MLEAAQSERYAMLVTRAFRLKKKAVNPWRRKRSHHAAKAAAAARPIQTRTGGPIQLRSKASFRNQAMPMSTARIPIRVRGWPPIRLSREAASPGFVSLTFKGGLGAGAS